MASDVVFDDMWISAEHMQQRATALAKRLYQDGIREGDVLAVMLRNDPAYIEAMLMCNLLGTYCCSINWHFKTAEAGHILKDSSAKVLIVHEAFIDQIGGVDALAGVIVVLVPNRRAGDPVSVERHQFESIDAYRAAAAELALPKAEPRGAMTYTSGSTGKPKGVRRIPLAADVRTTMLERRDEVSRAVFGITPDARCYIAAPLYHSAPFSYATFALSEGATIFLESRFDEARLLDLIARHRLSHLYLVPTMYQRLVRLPEEKRAKSDTSSVQFVASTGSPCGQELKRTMIQWWGPVFREAYASTETGYVTLIDSHDALRKPGSAGRPLPYAELKILDDQGEELPHGEIGLIYAVQRAYPDFTYANNDKARRSIERAGLVTLGDMGYLDEDGFLFVCDRRNDMVISGGVNIYPAEIEAVINQLHGVADSAVFGIPDDEFGEALAAAIQLSPASIVTEELVREHLREHMANYKVPKRIDFHAQLPREDTGKIFKRRLREPFWQSSGRTI